MRPTVWQVRRTRLAVNWYLNTHYGHVFDPGMRPMFYDSSRVGRMAVRAEELRAGTPAALFRLLITVAMFQRQRDEQVMRILRSLDRGTAREISTPGRLLRLSKESSCDALQSHTMLLGSCDLRKDPETKKGTCSRAPEAPCHLKRHTEALRRYGHFGKVPTSAALALAEGGSGGLRGLYRRALHETSSPSEAAVYLEGALSRSWRVSQKIACMFLSLVSNPDLGDDCAPWSDGVDWNHFVVIDSNTDLFLECIGFPGPWTYDARRSFVQALARRVDLRDSRPALQPYNARLVQQAMYLFMSASNRRALDSDCSHKGHTLCLACPSPLRSVCPVVQ